jgi:hypothetical protein
MMVKQSAFDGLVSVGAWLVLSAIARWRSIASIARDVVAYVVGACIALGLFVWNGISMVGWHDYWYLVYGYHSEQRSFLENPRFLAFFGNAAAALPIFLVAVYVIVQTTRKHTRGTGSSDHRNVLVWMWLVVTFVAVATGGNYHRHYFLVIVAPIAVLTSIALTKHTSQLQRIITTHLAISVVVAVVLVAIPKLTLGSPPFQSESVATWVRHESNRQGKSLRIYAFCTAASVYAILDQEPDFKYLWRDGVELVPEASGLLMDYLDGPNAPEVFAQFQNCKVSDAVHAYVATHYQQVDSVDGVELLLRRNE